MTPDSDLGVVSYASAEDALEQITAIPSMTERIPLLESALEQFPSDFDLTESLVIALAVTGDYESAIGRATVLLDIAEGDNNLQARARLDFGDTMRIAKAPEYETRAAEYFQTAEAFATLAHDNDTLFRLLLRWSSLDEQVSSEIEQDPTQRTAGIMAALVKISRAAEIARQTGNPAQLAEATYFYVGTAIAGCKDGRLGDIYEGEEDPITLLDEALELSERVADQAERLLMQGNIHTHFGRLHAIDGVEAGIIGSFDASIDYF